MGWGEEVNDYELRQFRNLESEQAQLTAERDALKAEVEALRGYRKLVNTVSTLKDVAQYANAIGQIDAVLGIVGNAPVSETVAGVEALRVENEKLLAARERLEGKLSDRQGLIEEAEEHLADIRMYERDRAIAECDALKAGRAKWELDAIADVRRVEADNERLKAEVATAEVHVGRLVTQLTELRGAVEVLEKTMREGATTQGNGWSSDERRSASFWAGKLDAVLAKVQP